MAEQARRRRLLIAGSVAGVIALIGVGALIWFLTRSAPEAVSLESAVEDVAAAAVEAPSSSAAEGIEGDWIVDTSVGVFSFEDATSSFVGFRIKEELATIGATEAVGRTPTIDGRLTIEGTEVTDVTVVADMTDIVTETSRRDSRVQSALSTSEFPNATFALTESFDIGRELTDGDQFSVTAVGDLTITDVTRQIEIPLEAQVVGDVVVVVGSVEIVFADWNVEVPSAAVVLSVEDRGPLELQLFFTRS
ncbi:MAG: YceI family protein [Acidimicrobiia bacterium]|nr:YceI family protein [Acidimicrobiia bacterium]